VPTPPLRSSAMPAASQRLSATRWLHASNAPCRLSRGQHGPSAPRGRNPRRHLQASVMRAKDSEASRQRPGLGSRKVYWSELTRVSWPLFALEASAFCRSSHIFGPRQLPPDSSATCPSQPFPNSMRHGREPLLDPRHPGVVASARPTSALSIRPATRPSRKLIETLIWRREPWNPSRICAQGYYVSFSARSIFIYLNPIHFHLCV